MVFKIGFLKMGRDCFRPIFFEHFLGGEGPLWFQRYHFQAVPHGR